MALRKKARSREVEPEFFEDEDDFDSNSGAARERFRILLYDLLGRWHWIALGLILGVLGSLYYLSKAPKIYEATSTLFCKPIYHSFLV